MKSLVGWFMLVWILFIIGCLSLFLIYGCVAPYSAGPAPPIGKQALAEIGRQATSLTWVFFIGFAISVAAIFNGSKMGYAGAVACLSGLALNTLWAAHADTIAWICLIAGVFVFIRSAFNPRGYWSTFYKWFHKKKGKK